MDGFNHTHHSDNSSTAGAVDLLLSHVSGGNPNNNAKGNLGQATNLEQALTLLLDEAAVTRANSTATATALQGKASNALSSPPLPQSAVEPTPSALNPLAGKGSNTITISDMGTTLGTTLPGTVSFKGGDQATTVDGSQASVNLKLEGGKGTDTFIGGKGANEYIWNPGEGSQIIHGGAGTNNAIINGGKTGEVLSLGGQDNKAVFNRFGAKPFSETADGVETFSIHAQGQGDTFTVGSGLAAGGVKNVIFTSPGGAVLNAASADVDIASQGGAGDVLIGGTKNNTLNGAPGETLIGGSGTNSFGFVNTGGKIFAASDIGTSTIVNFKPTDHIALSKATFAALTSTSGNGFSNAGEFATVASDADAAKSSALIVYSHASGGLFYNSNGTQDGLGRGSEFAVVTGTPQLTAQNFNLD